MDLTDFLQQFAIEITDADVIFVKDEEEYAEHTFYLNEARQLAKIELYYNID